MEGALTGQIGAAPRVRARRKGPVFEAVMAAVRGEDGAARAAERAVG